MIIFTNYKKVYFILGSVVILLGSLYVVSEIVSRRGDGANTASQASKLSEEEVTMAKTILLDKTKLIINSPGEFQKDPVFQGIKSDSLNEISSDISRLKTNRILEYGEVFLYPNGLMGKTYVQISDNTSNRADLLEFVFQRNNKNEWRFTDFKIINSVK